MRIPYTKRLADKMEECGVALRSSGAYVHRSFKKQELESLKKEAGKKHQFSPDNHLIVANGRGVLVRRAKLSKDNRFASYPGGIMSLEILSGNFYSETQFADMVRKNQGVKIMISSTGERIIGVLYGSLDKPYATLIDVHQGGLSFTDIETNERSNNRQVVCKVLDLNREDEKKVSAVRRAIGAIARKSASASNR